MSRRQLVLAAAIILAAGGHVGWSYWPRERVGRLEEGSATAALLLASDLPYRAWVAYPHQNLGVLERFRRRSAPVAHLAQLPLPDLPSFGPLATPPARDLAVASSSDGRRFVLVARVYPWIAVLARWAGELAGNPWLAGGGIGQGERRAEVTWRGSTWIVARDARAPARQAAAAGADGAALAALALGRSSGPLPAGLYLLHRRDGDLELATEGGADLRPPPLLSTPGAPLVVLERSADAVDLLALLPAEAGGTLPRWAQVHRGVGRRPSLPGEKLYDLVGRAPLVRRFAGDRLAATDPEALETARLLRDGLDGGGEAVGFAAVGDLAATARALGPLVEQLSQLPLAETRRWGAVLSAARAVEGWSRVVVVVGEGPERPAVVRLLRSASGPEGD